MRHLAYTLLLAAFAVSCSGRAGQNDPGDGAVAAVGSASGDSGNLAGSETGSQADSEGLKERHADADILRHTIYTAADSARVVSLLREEVKGGDVLFYARQFKGVPYVASTLEVADPERLVVNLRQLDCTTLVETALALAMTHRQGETSFAAYCRNLMSLRYWGGRMDGYLSRLHYFTWWMHDHLDRKLITEVRDDRHFTAPITVANHYMSRHADKYRLLAGHPARIDSIARLERRYNGPDGTYLPAALTGLSRRELSVIHDGDIVAIVTRKDGIDYSHLGFAVWGRDGKLHLLNASQLRHRVVEEPLTLREYLRQHPTSVGIRLFRLR